MPHTIAVSDEANEILERKATRLRTDKPTVLEWMIGEFSPSTPEEQKQQQCDRDRSLRDFIDSLFRLDNDSPLSDDSQKSLEKAWKNGFNAGWKAFQLRKSNSMYVKLVNLLPFHENL